MEISPEAIRYVEASQIPSTLPNGRKSYTVHYPCQLNGEVMVLNSRDIEFAAAVALTSDPQVLYVLTQPAVLDLGTADLRSRYYSTDFLVVWKDHRPPTLIETKPTSGFAKLMAKHPERYKSDGSNGYDMPLAAAAAAKLGFTFRTMHEGHLNEKFLRNSIFLDRHRQLRELSPPASLDEKEDILMQVAAKPGIKITEIVHPSMSRRADLVHHLLATGQVFSHLDLELLTEPNRVALFPTAIQQRAFAILHSKNPEMPKGVFPYVIHDGLEFTMAGKLYTVVQSSGPIKVRNHRGAVSKYSTENFLALLPSVDAFLNAKLTKEEQMRTLSQEDMAEMLRRYSLITPYLSPTDGGKALPPPTNRTLQRYLAAYREADAQYPGYGVYGLIPRTSERGSKKPIFPPATVAMMHRVILKHYLKAHPRLMAVEAHDIFVKVMQRLKVGAIPSYRTFARECLVWSKGQRDMARWGKRIAQLGYVPTAVRSLLGTPHGERPFSVAHADHTVDDAALDHPDPARRLRKAVHSAMVDATTDRSLAWVTSLDGPNTETVIALLRHCVKRNQCLPSILYLDWGADFRSTWLQKTLCAHLGVTIIYRMKANGPAGTPVEGKFQVKDVRENHRKLGSTQIMKRARLATKSVLPYGNTVWTLKDYTERCDQYHETFNSTPYGKAKQSPNEREKELCRIYGDHPRAVIPMELMDRLLLPFVDQVRRKVDRRCRIFVKGYYYASEKLETVRGDWVDVRQRDPKIVYASHPKLPGLVECPAVSIDLKHALTDEDARTVIQENAHIDHAVNERKRSGWAAAAMVRRATESRLKREKRRRAKPAEATTETPPPDNVVEFAHSHGGLTDLLDTEGQQ